MDEGSLNAVELDGATLIVVELAEELMTGVEVCVSVAVAEGITMEMPISRVAVKPTDTPWSRLS